MPPEPLPIDRKDFFKDRKPSSSDPVGSVPARWRELPTTPSQNYNHGSSFSCRRGGGPSDFRRSISGHGKPVGGGWHVTTAESGPHESKYCRNDSIEENNSNMNRVLVACGSQKDLKGGNSRENSASPNGSSHPHSEFVNSLESNDHQHDNNNGGGVKRENSLGTSLDWKPIKWIRSGSLSSRGSGFSHTSSCKIIGVASLDTKIEPLQSPSGDAAPCVTPRTPDEASSHKKPRLRWGEGLAKYEKKKVGPDDVVDKEAGVKGGIFDGGCSPEPLLPSASILPDKSPSLNGYSECASPATSCSFACSSSPGVEEKESIKEAAVDIDTSCNQTEGSTFNLVNVELIDVDNLSSVVNELLQSDGTSATASGFLRCSAMDKLQVWKADISRALEITESEIDSLETELKSLISDPAVSGTVPTACNNNNAEESFPLTNISSAPDGHIEVEGLDPDSPTSEFVEPIEQKDFAKKDANCSVVTGSGSYIVSVGGRRKDKLCDLILATNKEIANRASDELSKILPTADVCTNKSEATSDNEMKEKLGMRKRFLKFKERVITLKYRALQYTWKEDLRLLSIRRISARSQKKFESTSRMGYADQHKHRSSLHSRFSFPDGSLSLVPTAEIVDYLKKDQRVRIYRGALKMPCLILDRSERSSRFISDNGLVENPVDVEKEKSVMNPWTIEEKEVFLDKYSLFGKKFKKIASFLERKTIADCVEFYYKNHKSERFQETKKNSEFAKDKSCTANTYLVTSGRRLNRGSTSLEMLGAASAMVDKKGCTSEFNNLCKEQEREAADVLAGICGSEAFGSCITSSADGDVHYHYQYKRKHIGRRRCQKLGLTEADVDVEETCLDEWTDEEKGNLVKGVRIYGKDFGMVSRCVRTRSSNECRVFYCKARRCLGLDVEGGSEGTTCANQGEGEGEGGEEGGDGCLVDSASVISHSSLECKIEDVEADGESDRKVAPAKSCLDVNLEGAADTEAIVDLLEAPVRGVKVEDLTSSSLDLSIDIKLPDSSAITSPHNSNGNGFLMLPQDSSVVTPNRNKEDVSSKSNRLSFRKSGQSKDVHLPKHSLLPVSGGMNGSFSNFKLDESLVMPRVSQPQRRSLSPSRSGDVKLFGQILTTQPPQPNTKSFNLKFDSGDRRSASLDLDNSNLSLKTSYEYSAMLLPKYPPAFTTTIHQQPNLSAFQTPFTVDKLLLPTTKDSSSSATSLLLKHHHHGMGMMNLNIDGGGVSDPVAAIRMHYAKTQHYNNGAEPWRI